MGRLLLSDTHDPLRLVLRLSHAGRCALLTLNTILIPTVHIIILITLSEHDIVTPAMSFIYHQISCESAISDNRNGRTCIIDFGFMSVLLTPPLIH